MKPRYSLSIPLPCHENWLEMTSNEKGRFCQSCSKTVIDFTKMNTSEVQDFIDKNKNRRICGHIKQSQLDSINLQIYTSVFEEHMSFNRVFLLALLLTMGTTLLNCSDDQGNKTKRIDSVEIIDKVIDTTQNENTNSYDSLANCTLNKKADSVVPKSQSTKLPIAPVLGEIAVEGLMIIDEVNPNQPMSWDVVDEPAEFKNTPQHFTRYEKRDYFSKILGEFVSKHFKISQGDLDIQGKQKIYVQFTIDKRGMVTDIKTKSNNSILDKEAVRIIKLLPPFVPSKHAGKPVKSTYNLPIIYQVKDR